MAGTRVLAGFIEAPVNWPWKRKNAVTVIPCLQIYFLDLLDFVQKTSYLKEFKPLMDVFAILKLKMPFLSNFIISKNVII